MAQKRKIAVTGAGGFLGTALVRALNAHPKVESIRCLFSRPPIGHRPLAKTQIQIGELANETTAQTLVAGCDTVVHFATRGFPSDPVDHPNRLVTENVAAMGNLLDAMASQGVLRLVHASSGGAIYAPPPSPVPLTETAAIDIRSPYALSKIIQEQFAALYQNTRGVEAACLRVSNPYGPGQWGRSRQGIFGAAFQKIMVGDPLPLWGTLDTRKDFLYVGDAAAAFLSVIFAPRFPTGIFHVGSGVGTSLKEGLELVEKISERRLLRQILATKPSDTRWVVLNSEKIRLATGWQATTSLEDGLRLTWEEILAFKDRKVA